MCYSIHKAHMLSDYMLLLTIITHRTVCLVVGVNVCHSTLTSHCAQVSRMCSSNYVTGAGSGQFDGIRRWRQPTNVVCRFYGVLMSQLHFQVTLRAPRTSRSAERRATTPKRWLLRPDFVTGGSPACSTSTHEIPRTSQSTTPSTELTRVWSILVNDVVGLHLPFSQRCPVPGWVRSTRPSGTCTYIIQIIKYTCWRECKQHEYLLTSLSTISSIT